MLRACLVAVFLCACERAPSRLERAAIDQAREVEDEDLARGEAALASLQWRVLPPPVAPAMDAFVELTLVLQAPAPAPADAVLAEAMTARLRSLGSAGAGLEVADGRVTLTMVGVPAAEVDTLVAALRGAGRVVGATVPRGLATIVPRDPKWQWQELPVARAVAEIAEVGLSEQLALEFSPAGAATLQRLTAGRQALAIMVDDLELVNAVVTSPLADGKLTVSSDAAAQATPGLRVAALAAMLATPLPAALAVERMDRKPYVDRGCADAAACEADCRAGQAPACLGALERLGATTPLELATWVCQMGLGPGCARVCEQDPRSEACREAAGALLQPGWLGRDRAGAAALLVRGCERGHLESCSAAIAYLVTDLDATADFATADHMLMQIRGEAALVQATTLRRFLLDQAKEMCEAEWATPASAAQACLFAAQAHRGGILAPSQPELERRWLRRAGQLLGRAAGAA